MALAAPSDTVARLPGPLASQPSSTGGWSRLGGVDWLPVLAVLIAGVAALIVVRFTLVERINQLEAALETRPPVAVIDYGSIQTALAAGASPMELQPAFAAVKEQAADLQRRGYLVINRAALESAPRDLVIASAPVFVAARPQGLPSQFATPPQAQAPMSRQPGMSAAPPLAAMTQPGAPTSEMTPQEAQALLRSMIGAGGGIQ
jgi:hypothetical protein